MGRGHGATRGSGPGGGSFAEALPGLPWTEGISMKGFDFAREAPQGVMGELSQQALDSTLASIDANIKDPQMRAEMKAMVTKMSKEMGGLPTGKEGYTIKIDSQKEIQKIGGSGYEFGHTDGSHIGLNRRYFKSYKEAESVMKITVANGNSLPTKNPVMNTLAHEIGHGYYNRLSTQGKQRVEQVLSHFHVNNPKGWRAYSRKSASEFYADAVAKSVLGTPDNFTRILGSIR